MKVTVEISTQVVLCCMPYFEVDGRIIWSEKRTLYGCVTDYPYVLGEKVIYNEWSGTVASITRTHKDCSDRVVVTLAPHRIFMDYFDYLQLLGYERTKWIKPDDLTQWPNTWEEWKEVVAKCPAKNMPNEPIRFRGPTK